MENVCPVCHGTGIEWVFNGYEDIEEPRPCSECA